MMADQLQQPQNFVKELLPRFDISLDAQSQSTCTYCRKHLPINHERIYCQCKCRVFCSNICPGADELRRSCCPHNCQSIQEKTEDVMAKLNDFGYFGFDIHAYLTEEEREGVPSNMYGFGYTDENEVICPASVKSYFIARENLIKELINEAMIGEHINNLALDIALMQCKDSFRLDKFDTYYAREEGLSPKKEYLLSLLLFTGKFDEHYNVCCYYMQAGEQFLYHPESAYEFDPYPLNIIPVTRANSATRADMTGSFFDVHSLYHGHFPHLSLNHMYINRYIVHMNTENLRLLQSNVLDNADCVALIGEFIGIKKEWQKYENNWNKDQAFDVLREFARGDDLANQFGNMHGMADTILASGKYNQISTALKIGRGQLKSFLKLPDSRTRKNLLNWALDMDQLQLDVNGIDFHKNCIHPIAVELAEKLNEIAGYSVYGANQLCHPHYFAGSMRNHSTFGLNHPRPMCATKFLTEVVEVCEKNSYCFGEFLDYMDEQLWDRGYYDGMSSSLLKCLLLERRLIQAEFYFNHSWADERATASGNHKVSRAHNALNQLPSELSPYYYRRPLPLLDDDPFLNYPSEDFREKEDAIPLADQIKLVGGWLTDVTRVIDSLYHVGLATNDNLTAIFGDSSLVSYRLYELQKIDMTKNQSKITSYFSRKSR